MISSTSHGSQTMTRGTQVLLQPKNLDLLLHLAPLKLQNSHILIIRHVLLNLLSRDRLHLSYECLAGLGDGFGGQLEPV